MKCSRFPERDRSRQSRSSRRRDRIAVTFALCGLIAGLLLWLRELLRH